MYAAAEGHSNLGIPQSVGREFVKHDDAGKPELGDITDREAAEMIRDGELPSPTKYGDFWLFDLRITGTGAAYRDSIDEYAFRDPSLWLTDEFVDRCNGLAVTDGHPERSGLNQQEFHDRSVGSIVLPYIKGDEVWGIAKIFSDDMATLMQTTHRSTSPGVTPPQGSVATELNDGTKVLAEGLPLILDHLAICEAGVWDKNGPPLGIRLDRKDRAVADKTEELEKELKDAKEKLDAEKRRADALEEEKKDRARRDAEESERKAVEAAEKEKADRKARHDCPRMDGESDEMWDKRKKDARKDATEEERKELEERDKEREDKRRKDAAAREAEVEANRGTELHDSKFAAMQAEIDRLKAANAPLTIEDRNAIAKTFHRWDALFQMLGDATPHAIPGESPIAYRRRLANTVRPYTQSFQNYVFHDSQQPIDFDLVENRIFDEAMVYAKNPPADKLAGVIRPIVDTTSTPGKRIVRFIGDAKAVWRPFQHPTKFAITKINRPTGQVYR